MNSDPFKIVPLNNPKESQDKIDSFSSGDDWLINKNGNNFFLTYLSGHFQTEEVTVQISELDAMKLKNGELEISQFRK